MKRFFLLLLFPLFSGLCGQNAAPTGHPYRIVSLAPALTEILFHLGGGAYLTGRSSACDYPAEIRELPIAGDFAKCNLEQLLRLRPTHLLLTSILQPNLLPILRQNGTCILHLSCENLQEYQEAVQKIAKEFQLEEAGRQEIANTRQAIRMFRNQPHAHRPRLLAVIWDHPLIIAGKNTLVQEYLSLAGAIPASPPGISNYFTPSLSWLLQAHIDGLLVLDSRIQPEKHPLLSRLSAVKNGKIYQISNPELLQRAAPRWPQGIRQLQQVLFPEESHP